MLLPPRFGLKVNCSFSLTDLNQCPWAFRMMGTTGWQIPRESYYPVKTNPRAFSGNGTNVIFWQAAEACFWYPNPLIHQHGALLQTLLTRFIAGVLSIAFDCVGAHNKLETHYTSYCRMKSCLWLPSVLLLVMSIESIPFLLCCRNINVIQSDEHTVCLSFLSCINWTINNALHVLGIYLWCLSG